MLAQSLNKGGDTATSATDSSSTSATGKVADDGDKSSSSDPNAIALALASQSLAAALGLPAVTPPMAAASAAASGSGTGTTDGVSLTSRSSINDIVALLTQGAGADTKSKATVDALVDAAAAKGNSTDTTAAGAASTAAAASNSLAHLGIGSHFSVQHAQAESNTTGQLSSPVGTAAWNDELGNQLTWMTHQGLDSASLRLSPEHLGPLEVRISVQNGDASVWFGATHPDTRAALEQALPHLREMFANQGLTLTDSGVSRESPRQQSKNPAPQGVAAVSAIGGTNMAATSAVRVSLGLLDTYA
jgi:flagellar hook-length control protein FliK